MTAPTPGRPGPIGLLTSFWSGFATPSATAAGLMLASGLVAAVAVCTLFTPQLVAGPMGQYLSRSIYDNESYATREALGLALTAQAADKGARSLYLISDSNNAHAFASDTETAAALERSTGKPWRATFMTTGSQGPLDEATLADYATRHGPGVVILSGSFERFGDDREEMLRYYHMERLGIRSDWADQKLRDDGIKPRWRTGVYAIDNANFMLQHGGMMLLRALVHKAVPRQIDNFVPRHATDERQRAMQRRIVIGRLRHGIDPRGFGVRYLTDTVHKLQARGNVVIFAEETNSADLFYGPQDRALYDVYLAKSKALAQSLGAGYCRLADAYDPPPSAYSDYVHVIDRTVQARLRQALAECVAAELKSRGKL